MTEICNISEKDANSEKTEISEKSNRDILIENNVIVEELEKYYPGL